eukprot:6668-Pleurochrysis_carterae.AAC.1
MRQSGVARSASVGRAVRHGRVPQRGGGTCAGRGPRRVQAHARRRHLYHHRGHYHPRTLCRAAARGGARHDG